MKLKTIIIFIYGHALVAASAAAQPQITLPPDEPARAISRPPILDLPRESQIEVPLDQPIAQSSTAIGGYFVIRFYETNIENNVV
jgi:hypothetical protein